MGQVVPEDVEKKGQSRVEAGGLGEAGVKEALEHGRGSEEGTWK